jgi:hypothetical protein
VCREHEVYELNEAAGKIWPSPRAPRPDCFEQQLKKIGGRERDERLRPTLLEAKDGMPQDVV